MEQNNQIYETVRSLTRQLNQYRHEYYNLSVMADKLYVSYNELYNEKNNLELSGDE